jgi:hypothetical protein
MGNERRQDAKNFARCISECSTISLESSKRRHVLLPSHYCRMLCSYCRYIHRQYAIINRSRRPCHENRALPKEILYVALVFLRGIVKDHSIDTASLSLDLFLLLAQSLLLPFLQKRRKRRRVCAPLRARNPPRALGKCRRGCVPVHVASRQP